MMIEPPRQPRIGGVFEIDDGVHVAVEHSRLEEMRRFVRQAGKSEFRAGMEFGLHKTTEIRRRGRAVEAVIVIQNSDPHERNSPLGKLASVSQMMGLLRVGSGLSTPGSFLLAAGLGYPGVRER